MLYGIACLHCADVWVEAGEDNAAVAAVLQYAGQDDVQEGVHVEVGRQVLGPRPVLLANTIAFIQFIHRNRVDQQTPLPPFAAGRVCAPCSDRSISARC